jgi:hypothetical protein
MLSIRMPEIRNPLKEPPAEPAAGDDARTVWLKMLGLLVAIAAFGLLIYGIVRTVRLNL